MGKAEHSKLQTILATVAPPGDSLWTLRPFLNNAGWLELLAKVTTMKIRPETAGRRAHGIPSKWRSPMQDLKTWCEGSEKKVRPMPRPSTIFNRRRAYRFDIWRPLDNNICERAETSSPQNCYFYRPP
jgi:hypothetical protein